MHRDGLAERSEEHTSELQSQSNLVCRLLLEKKNKKNMIPLLPLKSNPSTVTVDRQHSQVHCIPLTQHSHHVFYPMLALTQSCLSSLTLTHIHRQLLYSFFSCFLKLLDDRQHVLYLSHQ